MGWPSGKWWCSKYLFQWKLREETSKAFFFEKEKQKTFASFQKEGLSFLLRDGLAPRKKGNRHARHVLPHVLRRKPRDGRVIDAALQLHGGAGYMNEYAVARLWRDARVTRIFGGTSEIMKEVVSRSI